MSRTDLHRRVQEYADRNGLLVGEQLGSGMHGIVFASNYQPNVGECALKVHEREREYRRECEVYHRLKRHGLTKILSCHVPQVLGVDDNLLIIQMTIVKRPFVLDFAGAYLDQAPDFSDEVMADWRAEKLEQFGPHWRKVQAVLGFLESLGIFMVDVNPGNISFPD